MQRWLTSQPKSLISSIWKNMTSAKAFKLLGTTILLFSFITQWTILNHAEARNKLVEDAQSLYMQSFSAGLQYQNLYFTHAQVSGVVDNVLIYKAAEQNVIGLVARIAVSDLAKEDKLTYINSLLEKSAKVYDLDSFNQYMSQVNLIEPRLQPEFFSQNQDIESSTSQSIFLYTALYIIGSLFLLVGIYLEKP